LSAAGMFAERIEHPLELRGEQAADRQTAGVKKLYQYRPTAQGRQPERAARLVDQDRIGQRSRPFSDGQAPRRFARRCTKIVGDGGEHRQAGPDHGAYGERRPLPHRLVMSPGPWRRKRSAKTTTAAMTASANREARRS